MDESQPIYITVPGNPDDPRDMPDPPEGVIIKHSPPLHPDDTDVVDGIPVTSVSRTLIDMAEIVGADELREIFVSAIERGMFDREKFLASRARVEWRPSLSMLDTVAAEFI